jgi:hypothetical protein
MIQSVIDRMAGNSTSIKGWAITTCLAVDALVINSSNEDFSLLLFLPVIVFYFLDSSYLYVEKNFIYLFKKAVEGEIKDYEMSPSVLSKNIRISNLLKAMTSWSVIFFYSPLFLVSLSIKFH